MFCKYCGKRLEDNEVCTCPEAQAEAAGMQDPQPAQPAQPSGDAGVGKAPAGAPLKKFFPLVLALVVLAVLGAVILLNRKTTLDMKDYLQVRYSGMDTVGAADVQLDWMSLDSDALGDSPSFLTDSILLESAIRVEAAPTEGLSNGDTVTVTVTCDEATAERYKLKLINTTVDFTVSDLPEGIETDVFADMEVTFEGTAPNGTAVVSNRSEGPFVKSVSFVIEPSNGLSNGDTVTVTARYNEQNAQDQLRVISQDTITVKVSGLDEYVTSYDQLDEDTLEAVSAQARDVINTQLLSSKYEYGDAAYTDDEYYDIIYDLEKESIVLTDVTLQTTYFAASKPDTNNWYNNELIQVYKITATDNQTPDVVTFYYSVGFTDFVKKGDGALEVTLTDNTSLYGNPSIDAVYNEVVAPMAANYSVTQS